MKLVVFAIGVLLNLNSFAAMDVIPQEQLELANDILTLKNSAEVSKKLATLNQTLTEAVTKEIDAEALALKMDRDSYIDDPASFDAFTKSVLDTQPALTSKPEKMVFLIKIGKRSRIQGSARFVSDSYDENDKKLMVVIETLMKDLGL